MALVVADRVKELTTTTGTGSVSLGGAPANFVAFSTELSDGDTTYYAIVDNGNSDYEVGIGTYTSSGNTLSRDTVFESSNSGAKVNLQAGQKDVFITFPASKALVLDASGEVSGNQTFAGTVTLNADPTTGLQAATKQYVDDVAAEGIQYHTPVRVEKEGNLNATYNNGSSGVGATLTNAGTQAALVIDGVTLSLNDRVLVYEQTDQTQNGVYTVTNTGSASTNWVLTRSTDTDSYAPSDPDALGQGSGFFVQEGLLGAGEKYVCNTVGTITFGTTNITFVQVSSAQIYTGGTGISITGSVISSDITLAEVTANGSTTTDNVTFGNITGNTFVSNSITYPTADGNPGEFIKTNGSGTLSFASALTATPTLAEVTTAGNNTTNSITVGDINASDVSCNALTSNGIDDNATSTQFTIGLDDAQFFNPSLPLSVGLTVGGNTSIRGALDCDAFTSTGIDDNATSTQLTINNTSSTFSGNLISSGDLGVGVTSPTATANFDTIQIGSGTGTGGGSKIRMGNFANEWTIQSQGGALQFYAGATTSLYMASNGYSQFFNSVEIDVNLTVDGDSYLNVIDADGKLTITNANYDNHIELNRSSEQWRFSPSTDGSLDIRRISGTGDAIVDLPKTNVVYTGNTTESFKSTATGFNYITVGSSGATDAGIIFQSSNTNRYMMGWDHSADNLRWYLYNNAAGTAVNANRMTLSSTGNLGVTGTITTPRIDLTNSNVQLTQDSGYFEIQTLSGYTRIGAGSTSYSHFYTDRGLYYFNTTVVVDGGGIRAYDSATDCRFPIYYDYNNTAYYCQPSSTSRLNVSYNNETSHLAEHGRGVKFWNSDSYKIYMSSTANTTWGGSAPGAATSDYNMYFRMTGGTNRGFVFRNNTTAVAQVDGTGKGYFSGLQVFNGDGGSSTYQNVHIGESGAGSASLHLQYRGDGYARFGMGDTSSGTAWAQYSVAQMFYTNNNITFLNVAFANGSFRAPIFYDSANTAYYADLASTSRMNKLMLTGTAGANDAAVNGLQVSSNYLDLYCNTTGAGGLRVFDSEGVKAVILYQNGSGEGGLLDQDASWAVRIRTGTNPMELRCDNNHEMSVATSYVIAYGSSRAPIFYDSNNTGYYADLSSTGDSIRAAGDIVAYYSDERLKDIEGNIPNALDKVCSLNGFYYRGNKKAQALGYDDSLKVGLSAQEVKEVLPEVIKGCPADANYMTLDYAKVVPLLVEAIKELKAEIEELKK